MEERIRISELSLNTFTNGFERKKDCSIWQAIFHVMEQECSDVEQAVEYAEAIADIEGEVLELVLSDLEEGAIRLYSRAGEQLSIDLVYTELTKLSDGQSVIYMDTEDAEFYLQQLNRYRLEAVEESRSAYVIYTMLLIQLEKEIQRNGPVLRFKRSSVEGLNIDERYLYLIGKGSLKNWKDVLLSDSATLVHSLVDRPKRGERSDKIENYQKLLGVLLYILSKILPSKCEFDMQETNDKKAARFSKLIFKNIDIKKSNFPLRRTVLERLREGIRALSNDVRTTDDLFIPVRNRWNVLSGPLEQPAARKSKK